jgi:hypothetical protein
MKIQKQIRNSILAGLAALVLIAAPVRARGLEDDGARQAASQQSWAASGDFTSETVMPGANGAPTTEAEMELGRVMVTDTVLLAIVLAGMVLIIVYTSFATRRRRDLRPVLTTQRIRGISYGPAAGAASR